MILRVSGDVGVCKVRAHAQPPTSYTSAAQTRAQLPTESQIIYKLQTEVVLYPTMQHVHIYAAGSNTISSVIQHSAPLSVARWSVACCHRPHRARSLWLQSISAQLPLPLRTQLCRFQWPPPLFWRWNCVCPYALQALTTVHPVIRRLWLLHRGYSARGRGPLTLVAAAQSAP